MVWRVEETWDCAGFEKKGKALVIYQKPKISRLLGKRIFLDAVSKKGRHITIFLTLEQAKRLKNEIERHLETRKRLDELYAAWALRDMFEDF